MDLHDDGRTPRACRVAGGSALMLSQGQGKAAGRRGAMCLLVLETVAGRARHRRSRSRKQSLAVAARSRSVAGAVLNQDHVEPGPC